jgi:hypothetical protein
MSDNPYEPPPIPPEFSETRNVARVSVKQVLWLLLGLVVAPPMAVGLYLLGVWLLYRMNWSADEHGLLPFALGLLSLALPIVPAYWALRWISHGLDAPEWWESAAFLIAVMVAIYALVYYFHFR